jgi:putative hydrolase of the HAD superfamily
VPHAILFDLDETLIDRTHSIGQYAQRLQQDWTAHLASVEVTAIAAAIFAADDRGYRPREALFADLVHHLPWHTPPPITALQEHWNTWFPLSSVARDGLVETLRTLQAQGIRPGIISNGATQRQQRKIDALQIRPYISSVVVSEAVQLKKPDARIFTLALAQIGCEASQAWFVGDHPVNDILGATAAGLQAIWLTGVHPWPAAHPAPRWHIASLPEIVPLVQHQHSVDSVSDLSRAR